MNITSREELQQRIQSNRYSTFTLPILGITFKYRRPDMLKLSFENALPAAMANIVIDTYKEAVKGTDAETHKKKLSETKIETNDELIKDLGRKGYNLLSELSVNPIFMDVPESDLAAEPTPLISWADVPEEDAIAFLMHIINRGQSATTSSGGEISAEDVTNFPDSQPVRQRNPASKSRKAVR